jgi:hypothetical protein
LTISQQWNGSVDTIAFLLAREDTPFIHFPYA